jgi:pyridoxal biosynthesis lyase PdxS
LRAFGVPFWALAHVFGRDPRYWYRLEVGLGRNRIVGTSVRQVPVPEHLLADEHHQPRDGVKNYVASTVAAGCCLGAALTQTAGAEDLQAGYGIFKQAAQNVQAA